VAVKKQVVTKRYALYNGDCCKVVKSIPDNSIDFSIFSPPFCNLYSYSDNEADMGNSKSYKEFFEHFRFLIKELYRIITPGRIVAVHCMEIPIFKGNAGFIGLQDFPGDLIKVFRREGFIFHSRHCIWKDPLLDAVRTKAIGLAHKQIIKDSSICRTGIPDYIIAFRKRGENLKPIENKDGLTTYHGLRNIPKSLERFIGHKEQKSNKRSHWIWQQYASPVWFDIRQTKVLGCYRKGREADDEKHICPLQLDTIERCMALWTRKDDKVFTPFMGIGSEIFVAIKNNRRGIGIELKESYYRQAIKVISSLKEQKKLLQNEDN